MTACTGNCWWPAYGRRISWLTCFRFFININLDLYYFLLARPFVCRARGDGSANDIMNIISTHCAVVCTLRSALQITFVLRLGRAACFTIENHPIDADVETWSFPYTQMIALALVLVCASSTLALTPADFLITDLPGLNFPINFNQYSGYGVITIIIALQRINAIHLLNRTLLTLHSNIEFNITHGRNMFFWFVESQSNPSTDPFVVWYVCIVLNGMVWPFLL